MTNRRRALITSLALLVAALAPGCAKAPDRQKTEAFFTEWLKSHGETNVVVDSGGVGVAASPARLKASLYGVKKDASGAYTAELEFKVRLPSGEEIIEYVIGMGKSEDEAFKDSELNFLLTTFHVVYRSFMNPADPHQTVHPVTVNGAARQMMMGDIYVRGDDAKGGLDFEALRPQIRDAISRLPLSPRPHWIKIVCGQAPGKPILLSAALDNQEHDPLALNLKTLKWPAAVQGYMMKEFIVVK